VRHGEPLGLSEWIDRALAEGKLLRARCLGRKRKNGSAIIHQYFVRLLGPIPFDHGEFGMMQRATLTIAKDASELDDAALAGGQELLAGELGRGAQIESRARCRQRHQLRREGMKMRLVAG
jgi:hypothetical protein